MNRQGLKMRRKIGLRKIRNAWWGQEPTPADIAKAGACRAWCSCWMCGNPRRHHGGKDKLTMQERRAIEAERAE